MAAPAICLPPEHESLIERFEAAWCRGEQPRIRDYVPDADDCLPLLGELIHADLEFRHKLGLEAPLAEYVREFPAIAASEGLLAELSTRESELRNHTPTLPGPQSQASPAPARASVRDVVVKTTLHGFEWVARGGMGDVWLAEDGNLRRSVAVKVLQQDHQHDPQARQRFIQEAQIASRLEHPGIAPVYGISQQADGRPCYAMRFVRGETLTETIRRYHADRGPAQGQRSAVKASESERNLTFRMLLNRFVAVCNTIAYAHECGVLHRDIKPDNIRLGEFGETVVLDWGLAKVTGDHALPEPEKSGPVRPALQSDALSRTGDIFGTLRYMSPEQALGNRELLGAASDVFGLGATLYEILTGKAPYHGDGIRKKAETGEYPPPRLVNREVPPALEAICLKAIAARPSDRYASARDLAQDVERYLADEHVVAHAETLAERSRRWIRKHPRSIAALTAAMLIGLAVGVPAAIVLNARNSELSESNAAQRKATEKAKASASEALAAQQRSDSVKDLFVSAFRSPDPRRDGRNVTIAEVLGRTAENLHTQLDDNPLVKASLLESIGTTYRGLALHREAIPLLEQAHALLVEALGEDHPETLAVYLNVASAYQEAGEWSKSIPAFRYIVPVLEAQRGSDDAFTLRALFNLGNATVQTGDNKQGIELLEKCLPRQQAVLGEEHLDTIRTLNTLGAAYRRSGRHDEAIPILQRGLEVRWEFLGEDHPDTVTSLGNLAVAMLTSGHAVEAIPLLQRCWTSDRKSFGDDHPSTLMTMSNLAEAYKRANREAEAVPLLEITLNGRRARLGDMHPDTLVALHNLAGAYRLVGRIEEAIAHFSQCLGMCRERLGRDHATTLTCLNSLATTYREAGQPEQALPLVEECYRLRHSKLGASDPLTLDTLRSYALTLALVGEQSAAEQRFGELFTLVDALPAAEAAKQWPRVLQAGVELAQSARQPLVAEVCLSEALRQQDHWQPTAANRAIGSLCLADCRLFAGDAPAAQTQYEALIATPDEPALAWIKSAAQVGLAATRAAAGQWDECDRLLGDHWPALAAAPDKTARAHRGAVAAIGKRILELMQGSGRLAEAARWQEQLDAIEQPPTGKN